MQNISLVVKHACADTYWGELELLHQQYQRGKAAIDTLGKKWLDRAVAVTTVIGKSTALVVRPPQHLIGPRPHRGMTLI